jgi:anti-sigma factor RsiW
MNCPDIRARLPGLAYGDLTLEERAAVTDHLRTCPACRKEEATLGQIRQLLDGVSVPSIAVDLPALYRQAAERHQRRARRWRRTALAALGMAATVAVLALAMRCEIRIAAHEMVLRWADAPSSNTPGSAEILPSPPPRAETAPPASAPRFLTEQIEVLSELVQGQQEEIVGLQARLDNLRRLVLAGNQRWLTTERDVAALSGHHTTQPK